MKYWIGPWLIGVSVIHTVFAFALFGNVLLSIIQKGLFDSVGSDPMVGAVAWFVLFGILLFILGQALWELEHAMEGMLPRSLGWSLLTLTILGVVLMPASGFWLAFPPAIAILTRSPKVRT
ncbi:MAG: DUF6463 family protein [Candidatus Thiodiazotropha sp.]|jgi:hypothetical protein